ncbi:MAG: hypothetical protein ABI596_13205 [Pyrinomonadaceae bacterium]
MRLLCSMLVLFLFALGASAQALSNRSAGPELTVMQKQWRMDVRNPALEKDPLQSIKGREQEVRAQQDVARQNERRIQEGLPALAPPVRLPAPSGPRGLWVTYIYEVNFHNTGEKGIRKLTWDYVFYEPGTEQEVGRLQFVRRVSIGPGKTRSVVVRTRSSPTGTIDATKAGKKSRDLYSEQIVIKSIGYADGSVWQAASN